MDTLLLAALLVLNLALLAVALFAFRRSSEWRAEADAWIRIENQGEALSGQFAASTADMAMRLEQTKGDLRQQVSDRLTEGFAGIRSGVEEQMKAGRREQSERLAETRIELNSSLALTTSQLKNEFDSLNQQTMKSLESIRDRVDAKLLAITDQVQQKLDQNIKEGFAQFEKVQQHLKAAEPGRLIPPAKPAPSPLALSRSFPGNITSVMCSIARSGIPLEHHR